MSSGNGKPAVDLFERIEEEAAKDEAARIAAMDDAQLDAELKAGGLDPAAVRARGRALGEKLAKQAAHARRVKIAKWAAVAAVVVVALVAAMLLNRVAHDEPLPSIHELTGGGPNVAAGRPTPAELRVEAAGACEAKDWKHCLELLDDAKEDDPEGDATPDVRALRARAARGLGLP